MRRRAAGEDASADGESGQVATVGRGRPYVRIALGIAMGVGLLILAGMARWPGGAHPPSDQWVEHQDEASHRPYWFNHATGESAWTAPPSAAPPSAAPPAPPPAADPPPESTQPKGWHKYTDKESGKPYWFNHDTGESSWTQPGAPPPPPLTQRRDAKAESQKPEPEPTGWQKHHDKATGQDYWFNHDTGKASWTDPRAAKGLATPPPPPGSPPPQKNDNWQQHHDEATGRKYWFNHVTGQSSWSKPGKATSNKKVPGTGKLEDVSVRVRSPREQSLPQAKSSLPVAHERPVAASSQGGGTANGPFVRHEKTDIRVHDYGCEGSDAPDVADAAAGMARCQGDHRCGAFVLTRDKTDGNQYSAWLKMRDSRYAASYAIMVKSHLLPADNVDTYVLDFDGSEPAEPAAASTVHAPPLKPYKADEGREAAAPVRHSEASSSVKGVPLDTAIPEEFEATFKQFEGQDFAGHDFDCTGSRVAGGCLHTVDGVAAAMTLCKNEPECGGFVIFHTANKNDPEKYTTWLKLREWNSVAKNLRSNSDLSAYILKDMGPKPKFSSSFTPRLYPDFKPVFGADSGVWDMETEWKGPPEEAAIRADTERLEVVRSAMKHAWDGYVQYAWGQDELKPVSNRGSNWLGMGATIIDSLDTLWIMGLHQEFDRARTWVATGFNTNVNSFVSFFETTIRCLGGLIAAFEMSGDQVFLDKAKVLGDKLIRVGWQGVQDQVRLSYGPDQSCLGGRRAAHLDIWLGLPPASKPSDRPIRQIILAEIGTVQLEFKALSRHTRDPKYHRTAHSVYDKLERITRDDGLCPLFLNHNTGQFSGGQISLGAMGDSYYEYLIKLYLYTKRTEPQYKRMYLKSLDGILKKLVFQTSPSGLTYVAEMNGNKPVHKMDHLACFVPGVTPGRLQALIVAQMLAIGAKDSPDPSGVMAQAHGITELCYHMYARQRSGVAPEYINLRGNDFTNGASHNLLRPEALEAMFVMFRYTGNPIYREWGWNMFLGFEQSCKTSSGYSGLRDVTNPNPAKDDTQQSFFLAETLKYAYLLFAAGDTIPLDKYVLNTEAHPLKMWDVDMPEITPNN